jgi:hypothetical protein
MGRSSYLVVGVHDGNDHCVRPQRATQVFRIDKPLRVDRQVGRFEALLSELLNGVEDSVMLDGRGDQVPSAPQRTEGGAPDRQVVALAAAAGKNDVVGTRAQDFATVWRAASRALRASRPSA